MPHILATFMNAVCPGSILILRGAPVTGVTLLALAAAVLSVALASHLLGLPEARMVGAIAVFPYLFLAAIASVALWWHSRAVVMDPATVRRLHRAAAAAWLRDDHAAARSAALDLVRHAPAEIGAWRILDLIATAAGDRATAQRAARRAARLEALDT